MLTTLLRDPAARLGTTNVLPNPCDVLSGSATTSQEW
jgi:hypothetical protein